MAREAARSGRDLGELRPRRIIGFMCIILEWQDPGILLPRLPRKIASGHFLKDGSKAEFKENDLGVLVRIPQSAVDEYDTILVLEMAR